MTPWINLICLIIATKLFLYFYVKSVGPAALEQRIGERAYRRFTTIQGTAPRPAVPA